MANAGLQVFDQSGNLMVNIQDRLAKIIGSARVTANGSVTDPNLLQGTPFYAFQQEGIWGFVTMNVLRPNFSVSGSTISWTYSASSGQNPYTIKGNLFYGIT
jgi:hypothetical protein